MQIDRFTVFARQRHHRIEHIGIRCGRRGCRGSGFQIDIAPVRGAQTVLAGVGGRADDPRFFVRRTVKGLTAGQQLEEDILADVLSIVGGLQIGVSQPQDQVGVRLHQTFGVCPVKLFHWFQLLWKATLLHL